MLLPCVAAVTPDVAWENAPVLELYNIGAVLLTFARTLAAVRYRFVPSVRYVVVFARRNSPAVIPLFATQESMVSFQRMYVLVDDPRLIIKPAFCVGATLLGTSEFKTISLSAMFNSCVFTVVTVPFIVRFLLIITSPLSVKF